MIRFARVLAQIILTLSPMAAVPNAHADSSARVLDTHPSDRAILGRGESFYVRIEYTTDEPISLWARPYVNGRAVEKTMSNASSKYVGSGQALGWFALTEPAEVDEVRVIAGGGEPYRQWELTRLPLQLRWTTAGASARPSTAWVEELTAAEDARRRADAQQRASQPTSSTDVALFNGLMLLMVALAVIGIIVPIRSVWVWQGGWKIAAAVPAAIVGFVVLRIVFDTARDPTSHNLWPFEMVMCAAVSLTVTGVLKLARRWLRVGESGHEPSAD